MVTDEQEQQTMIGGAMRWLCVTAVERVAIEGTMSTTSDYMDRTGPMLIRESRVLSVARLGTLTKIRLCDPNDVVMATDSVDDILAQLRG